MTESSVTLVAALIAAGVSVVSLIVGVRASATAEIRAANRRSLEPHIERFGQSLHEIVAATIVFRKALPGEARDRWRQRALEARATLKDIRPKVRYPLWGLDEPIRVLCRFPDWLDHAKSSEAHASKVEAAGDGLRRCLDKAVRNALVSGKPPGYWDRRACRRSASKLRAEFERRESE